MSDLGVSGLHLCFFADEVVLSASMVGDLQHTPEKLAAKCDQDQFEPIVLSRKTRGTRSESQRQAIQIMCHKV